MTEFEGYAELADVYALGLLAPAFTASPRAIEAVDTASGVITLRGHGLSADSPVRFSVESSSIDGAPAAALMGGVSSATPYYAQPVAGSSDLFKVSATEGGATIDSFTAAPVGVVGLIVDPIPLLKRVIIDRAGYINNRCIAYRGPFKKNSEGKWPEGLPGLNARMAARDALVICGLQNTASGPAKLVMDRAGEDNALLIDASQGKLVFGPAEDQTPTIVEAGAVSWSSRTDGGGVRDWQNVTGGGYL